MTGLAVTLRGQAAPSFLWHVIYTTPMGEKLLKFDLENMGYGVFLPLLRRLHRPARHRHSRERVLIERPLFPRYLFVGLNRAYPEYGPIRANKRVSGILSDSQGRPVEIPARVIEEMDRDVEVQDTDVASIRLSQALKMLGRDVTLNVGMFQGLLSTVESVTRRTVGVTVHGQGVSIKLDIPLLEFDAKVVLKSQDDQQKQSAPLGVG